MKILVADDDKEIVELLSIYIHNEGYEVVKAYDGKEALSKLHTTPDIDLLILDIMMPIMDGMEVVNGSSERTSKRIANSNYYVNSKNNRYG